MSYGHYYKLFKQGANEPIKKDPKTIDLVPLVNPVTNQVVEYVVPVPKEPPAQQTKVDYKTDLASYVSDYYTMNNPLATAPEPKITPVTHIPVYSTDPAFARTEVSNAIVDRLIQLYSRNPSFHIKKDK